MLIFSHISAKKYPTDIFDDFIIKHLWLVVNIIILYIGDNLHIYTVFFKYAVYRAGKYSQAVRNGPSQRAVSSLGLKR